MNCAQRLNDDEEFRRFVVALDRMARVCNPTQVYLSTAEIVETVQAPPMSLDDYLKSLQDDGLIRLNPAIGGVAVSPDLNRLACAAKKANGET